MFEPFKNILQRRTNPTSSARVHVAGRGIGGGSLAALCRRSILLTVGTRPEALRRLFQVLVVADEMVGPRTGVAQDDLAALLAHLAIVLVLLLHKIGII
jgi:hypothetical protein